MVAVVVDDEDAVRLAAHLEAPLGAAELPQAGRDALERQPELEADGDRRQRVLQVVPARHVAASAVPSVTGGLRRIVGAPRAPLARSRVTRQRTEARRRSP